MRPATIARWIAVVWTIVGPPRPPCPPARPRNPAADFFRGKRINLYVSSTVGGGYDQYARLLAKHIVRHIPGEPTIIVQNMVGAEGIRAANYISTPSPPQDGTAIGALSRNIGLVQLYERQSGIQFDARKIALDRLAAAGDRAGIISTRTGLRSLDDLQKPRRDRQLHVAQCADLGLSAHAQRALRHQAQSDRRLSRLAGIADRVRARRSRGLCVGRHQRRDAGADGRPGSRAAPPRRSCRWA